MTHSGNAPQRVLFVITKSNWGGAQKYVYDLATGLDPAHWDVAVALGGSGPLAEKLTEADIAVHTLPMERDVKLLGDLRVLSALYRLMRAQRPDVVHLNSSKAGGLGGVAARLARVPRIIFTGHGWAFNEDRPRWHTPLIRFFVWLTLLFSHRVICVSDAVRKDINSLPFTAHKLTTVHNGTPERTYLTRTEAREAVHVPPGALVAGIIAELHPTKGHRYLLEALMGVPELSLVIIGDGELREVLEADAAIRGLSTRVHFVGHLPDAPRYLKAFDIFVLPSVTEALALVVLEAGAAGVPVVASRVGGIPEIITSEELGILVPRRDVEALADALSTLANDTHLRNTLGSALQTRVREHFSLTRMIEETEALYRS